MKFLPTILLLLPLLTACNSELDFGGDTPGTKNAAIGFSNNMKITRAEATLTEIQTNGFSVWGGYVGNTVFDGRKVTYNDSNSEWGYEPTEYWTYNTYDFHGVYPTPDANSTDKNYTITWNNTATKALNITGFDASSGIDLLHSPLIELDGSDTDISGRPIEMNFNHILTNVNVELVKATENSEHDIRITQVVIYGLCTKGDYSWTKENAQWDTDELSISYISKEINNIALEVKSDNANDNYGYTSIISDVLCIPQDINENSIYLGVAYDFKQNDATDYITGNSMIVALPTTYNWTIGEKVTYRATIDAHMKLVFGAPGIEAWGEEPESGTIIIK